MLAQIAECEADRGRTLTFTDADFIATLNKLDSMREKLKAYKGSVERRQQQRQYCLSQQHE